MSEFARRFAELEKENARLAAVCKMAYEALGWIRGHVQFTDRMNVALIELAKGADSTALRDLLGPTVEHLKQDIEWHKSRGWESQMKRAQAELARLRAAMGEKL